jgi:type II secretory pathway component PulK
MSMQSRMRGHGKRGQTLVIALLVTFVLLVLGGVFIVTIARNLLNVQQAREGLSADYFAEAGIRYAVEQLVNSEEGRRLATHPR